MPKPEPPVQNVQKPTALKPTAPKPTVVAALPILLTFKDMQTHFNLGKIVAYALAAAGEITTLTLGTPGTRGKRVFLAQSVLDYIDRQLAAAPEEWKLKTGAPKKA